MKFRIIVNIALLMLSANFVLAQECEKCDLAVLEEVSNSLNQLDDKIMRDFLCSLDTICTSNVEFSEWSNQLLFQVAEKNVNLFNKVLHDLGYSYVLLVAAELESPVIEVDLNLFYQIFSNAYGPKDMIYAETHAIELAAKKSGVKLKNNN